MRFPRPPRPQDKELRTEQSSGENAVAQPAMQLDSQSPDSQRDPFPPNSPTGIPSYLQVSHHKKQAIDGWSGINLYETNQSVE